MTEESWPAGPRPAPGWSLPRYLEQLPIWSLGLDMFRSGLQGLSVIGTAEAVCGMDHVKAHPASLPEDLVAGSQHGELLVQSTENVGVRNGIERAGPEWKPGARTDNKAALPRYPISLGAIPGPVHSSQRQVAEHDVTT